MNLSDALDGFFLSLSADGYSPCTIADYRTYLGRMVAYLSDPSMESITTADVRRFLAWLREEYQPQRCNGDTKPLSPHTLSNVWCGIRSFYRWASEELGVKRPDENIKQPRYRAAAVHPLSKDDISKLLAVAEYTAEAQTRGRKTFSMRRPTGRRDVALILLLLDCGLRVSEAARLRVSDVDLESGELRVAAFGTGRKTKGRHVYLGNAARRALWRYVTERHAQGDEPLFATLAGRPMDRNSIRLLLARLGERAGVKVHPHQLRHTMAVEFLRNGGDAFSLRAMLGHSTLDMVSNYVHLANADVASVHRRASPADHWQLKG